MSPRLYPHHNTVPRHIPYSQTDFSLPSPLSPSPNQPGYSTTHILSPSHDANSPDEGLKENFAYKRSDSPRSGGSPQSLRHSFKRRPGSESPNSDSLHDSGKHDSMSSLPGMPSHLYEDAEMIQALTSDSNGQSGYDKLEKAREEALKVIDGITPLSIEQHLTDSTVEKRIKSPSPKCENESPPLSSALTDTEIRQLKSFNREPLINKSATIHDRRKADYTYIELSDSSSEYGGDSRPTSTYDIPTRLASQITEKLYDIPQSQSIYDVPPPPRPTSNGSSHTSSIYDIPRSSVRDSMTATQRALPHLPTDYVNIQLGSRNPSDETYCEVPAPNKNITQSKSMINMYQDIPEHNLYSSPSDTALRRVESAKRVLLPGEKLAQDLAEEEGYVFVSPATRPVLTTPPPRSQSTSAQHDVPEEPVNDEYIEVRRNNSATNVSVSSGTWTKRGKDGYDNVEVIPIRPVPSAPEPVIDHDYVNFPINVRKWSDGYEEVKELRTKLSVSSDTTSDSDVIITTTEPDTTVDLHDLSLSPTQLMSTEYMHTNNIHETQDNTQDNTNVPSSIQSTPSEEGGSDNPLLLSGDPTNKVTIPKKTMIPIALGSPETSHMLLARKRSLTIGDPLDAKEAKKHTYENVPEDQYPPGALPPRSYTNDVPAVTKKPMPLPRPATLSTITVSSSVSVKNVEEKKVNSNNECQQASLSLTANSNHNNNKVKMLIRQFSNN